MILKHKLLIPIIYLLLSFSSYSQKIEFGIGGGVSHFKGDISPNFNPLQLGVGASGLFRYNMSRSVSLRGQILFSGYNAKDEKTTNDFYNYRNATATGNLLELAAIAEYNFLDKATMVKKKDWTPYLFGGVGYTMANNKSSFFTTPLKVNTPVIPYGVGVKFRFKGPFSVCAEIGTRYTISDDFDVNNNTYFGNTNVSTGTLINDKIQFGDLTRTDHYYFTSITLTYTIFNLICPE
jgi:hypothetical protein